MRRLAPHAVPVEAAHEPAAWQNASGAQQPPEALRGRPVAAFCGIGNPEGFRRTLLQLGADIVAWRTFPDHHAYSREDIEDLRRWSRQQPAGAALATTQKDLVKINLDHLGERELWALQIRMQIVRGQEEFERKLREVL